MLKNGVQLNVSTLSNHLWEAANILRGPVDAADFKSSSEGDISKALIGVRLVDCIVNLPAKLFLNTQIPACLWFLCRDKANGKFRSRTDEILFIDDRNIWISFGV